MLVSRLPRAVPDNPRTFITYKEVHNVLGLPLQGPTYGESLKRQGLTSLADWTEAEKLPAITGLIVIEETLEPGQGYFNLFGKPQPDYKWWATEISRSKEFNWAPFVRETNSLPRTPRPPDVIKPPEKVESVIYRILRDTVMTRRVKALHDFRCQICGMTMELFDGRFYAEAHHIRPLGGAHSGPDIPANILCLCPNHHAELDYGISMLDHTTLQHAPGHHVDPEFIKYHNNVIHKRKA